MNWIFPIAGKGKRVRSLGSYKPFIEIKQKKILEWFLISIKRKFKKGDKLYFITTEQFERKYKVLSTIKVLLNKLKIKNKFVVEILKKTPNGPALSVLSIINTIKGNQSCAVINSDQAIDFYLPSTIKKDRIYMGVHFNNHGKSSYINLEKKGKIFEIFEKKLISYYASSGVYIFGSVKIIKKCYQLYYSKIRIRKKELNMSDIINNYLKTKKTYSDSLTTYLKYDLGNKKDIENFVNFIESKL